MTATAPDVVVVGSLHMDVVVYASEHPRVGETVAGHSWSLRFGGKGGNQALQAAIQGARVAMVGRVGVDQFGPALLSTLREAGINTQHVRSDSSAGSGMGIALIDDQGIPRGAIVSGVNLHIGTDDLQAAAATIAGASCLLLQHEIPMDANIAAARLAKNHQVRVILNAAPAYPLEPTLIEQVDILVVNKIEAALMASLNITDVASAQIAAEKLVEWAPVVLVTLGGEGVVLQQRGQPLQLIPAYRVPVVDTLGAGDAFIGGLAARLVAGDALLTAVQYANATGALAVTEHGITGDHLHPDRVRALMRNQPQDIQYGTKRKSLT